MNLTLTPRDKKLLAFAAVLLLVVFGWRLVIQPQATAIKSLKDDVVDARNLYQLNSIYGKRLVNLERDKTALLERIKAVRTVYPAVLRHSEIIALLNKAAADAGVTIENVTILDYVNPGLAGKQAAASNPAAAAAGPQMNVTDPRIVDLMQQLGLGANEGYAFAGNTYGGLEIADGSAFILPVKVALTGNEMQIARFFSTIAHLPNQVLVKDFSMMMNDSNLLSVDATFDFYGIADRYAQNTNLMPDGSVLQAPAGGGNISLFSGPPGVGAASAGSTAAAEAADSIMAGYDFSMRVVPYGNEMAPATVSLSARGIVPKGKSSLIYGDSKGIETAELVIEEKQGKFFCKYRTQTEAFPESSFSKTVEFKPQSGDLGLVIDATPRKFAGDVSGVDLKVSNGTRRSLRVNIVNDDSLNPRVKVEKISGKVDVNRI